MVRCLRREMGRQGETTATRRLAAWLLLLLLRLLRLLLLLLLLLRLSRVLCEGVCVCVVRGEAK